MKPSLKAAYLADIQAIVQRLGTDGQWWTVAAYPEMAAARHRAREWKWMDPAKAFRIINLKNHRKELIT